MSNLSPRAHPVEPITASDYPVMPPILLLIDVPGGRKVKIVEQTNGHWSILTDVQGGYFHLLRPTHTDGYPSPEVARRAISALNALSNEPYIIEVELEAL